MKAILERELKFDVEPGFDLPDLGGRPLAARRFTSTYFDTPNHRLLRAGITLRRRTENRVGVWQLKLPCDSGRYELEERGGATLPGPFRDLLVAPLRGADLVQVVKLRTQRQGVLVGARPDRTEVTLDTVDSLEGRRTVSTFAEVEAEIVAGDGDLAGIAKKLQKAGARPGDGSPKLARFVPLEPTAEPDGADGVSRLVHLLVEQYWTILANDPGVRLGRDTEALHKVRVATRRARSLLRASRGLVAADWAEPLRIELKWLGTLLGSVRDVDVLLEHLDREATALEGEDAVAFKGLRSRLSRQRSAARQTLLEGMTSERYIHVLDALERAPRAPNGEESTSAAEIAGRAFLRLRKTVNALPSRPTDDELHRVRIATKRARYAVELAAPELGKQGRRFLERAKDLQDVIGDHQDACVAEDRLRALALRGDGRTGIAAGRLVERQRRRKRDARRAFPGVWRKLDKAGRAVF